MRSNSDRDHSPAINSANVVTVVVAADLCTGCGVCAGVCPSHLLEMKMCHGAYAPALSGRCPPRCQVCLDSCPFADHADSLDHVAQRSFSGHDLIQYDAVLGYYLACYVGYSTVHGHRSNGASGGMVTWTLERLMEAGEIDRVVTVRPVGKAGNPLFEMAVLGNAQEVRNAAGSHYYPVELSASLRAVAADRSGLRYAIVGVPCFCHGVRRAMNIDRRLARKVTYLVGLACGRYPTAQYTEAMCSWAGITHSRVTRVDYRLQKGTTVGWDFQFQAHGMDGKSSRPVGQMETFKYLWGRYYFAHNACLYCDDVFAEAADATFMDAWLPEYLPDTRGTSIVVVRQPRLEQVFRGGSIDGTCKLSSCSLEDVLASQRPSVREKRELLGKRIATAHRIEQWLPRMRQQASEMPSGSELGDILQRRRTVRASKGLWPYFRRLPMPALFLFLVLVDTYAGGVRYACRTSVPLLAGQIRRRISLAWRRWSGDGHT